MMNRILLVGLVFVVAAASLRGQDFTNLNFESAQVIISTNIGANQFITTANALPGWSAFDGTNQLSLIQYNPNPRLGSPPIALFGSNSDVIAGNFSVLLDSISISINQTGLVPTGTESLVFDAALLGSPPLFVSLGGQNLSYTAISSGTNPYGGRYSIYAADISAFAGKTETLIFSGGGLLDDIQFSPEMIPEPSTATLVFLSSGILFYVRRIRKKRRLA